MKIKYLTILLLISSIIGNSYANDSWPIRFEVSDGIQECIARTQPRIKNDAIVWDAFFTCDNMSFGFFGEANGFASEKNAIQNAIRNANSRCVKSFGCIRHGTMVEIEKKLKNIN